MDEEEKRRMEAEIRQSNDRQRAVIQQVLMEHLLLPALVRMAKRADETERAAVIADLRKAAQALQDYPHFHGAIRHYALEQIDDILGEISPETPPYEP